MLQARDKVRPSSVVRRWPAENGVSAEAEESPLLDAVTRKRLVKTLQAAQDLVFAADLQSVGISDGSVITCSSESCGKVFNKSTHQTKPRL
jgi:hypothetical protein